MYHKSLSWAVAILNNYLYISRFLYVAMNTKIVLAAVLGITTGMMFSMMLPLQQSFAYNKFGFDNQTQCVNITNLEFQGGLFDHDTHMKLLGMCEHTPAATNVTGP